MDRNYGFKRVYKAGIYSAKGLKAAFRNEEAFRQELYIILLILPFAFWIAGNIYELMALIACLVLVLIVELLNTGLEAIVDRIGSEYHELSGRAKDVGSAAVMLAIFLTIMVWSGIIWHNVK